MRYGAVIIASEETARMEQYKQLINMGNMSIAERVIDNFRRAGVEEIVLVTGRNADALERSLRRSDVRFIRNENYETTDMFCSARLGLEAVRGCCDRIFFTPVDVPFFTDQTVREEIGKLDEDPQLGVIIPSRGGRSGHPILINGRFLTDILAYNGDRGMKGAYEELPEGRVAWVNVDDEGAFVKNNTGTDFRRLVDIHNDRIMHPVIKLTMASTTVFLGPGTVRLLKETDMCGNVSEACGKCGFSYSKGWKLIRNCEEKFGWSVVERQAGGQSGGTARLTEKGHALVAAYEELEQELSGIADERFRELMKKYHLTDK